MSVSDVRTKLNKIIEGAENIVDHILKEELLELDDLSANFKAAFSEVKESTGEAKSKLKDLNELNELKEAGLSGNQLDLKYKGFDDLLEKWKKQPSRFDLLCDLLKWLKSILGSLVKIVPQIEPLNEFVELLIAKKCA